MLTILMIDDDKGDVETLRAKISNAFTGMDFMAVFGHKMGLWKLNRFRPEDEDLVPDAIIHEASFADGSSVEIVRCIRGSRLLSRVPVLIYTGTDDEEIKRSKKHMEKTYASYKKIWTKRYGQVIYNDNPLSNKTVTS